MSGLATTLPTSLALSMGAGVTVEDAQREFDRIQERYRDYWRPIHEGNPATVETAQLPPDVWSSLRDAIEFGCWCIWGQGIQEWKQDGTQWTFTPPNAPPNVPDVCMSCGAPRQKAHVNARWRSPGLAGGRFKETGWEHRCCESVPQAGYFTMGRGNPYPIGTPECIQHEHERLGEGGQWQKTAQEYAQSHKQARQAELKAEAEEKAKVDTQNGHRFDDFACVQCGLAAEAYRMIPFEERTWRCPGEPAVSPIDVEEQIRTELELVSQYIELCHTHKASRSLYPSVFAREAELKALQDDVRGYRATAVYQLDAIKTALQKAKEIFPQ
jgi:hypothetical protein